jgi:hypothetical protein
MEKYMSKNIDLESMIPAATQALTSFFKIKDPNTKRFPVLRLAQKLHQIKLPVKTPALEKERENLFIFLHTLGQTKSDTYDPMPDSKDMSAAVEWCLFKIIYQIVYHKNPTKLGEIASYICAAESLIPSSELPPEITVGKQKFSFPTIPASCNPLLSFIGALSDMTKSLDEIEKQILALDPKKQENLETIGGFEKARDILAKQLKNPLKKELGLVKIEESKDSENKPLNLSFRNNHFKPLPTPSTPRGTPVSTGRNPSPTSTALTPQPTPVPSASVPAPVSQTPPPPVPTSPIPAPTMKRPSERSASISLPLPPVPPSTSAPRLIIPLPPLPPTKALADQGSRPPLSTPPPEITQPPITSTQTQQLPVVGASPTTPSSSSSVKSMASMFAALNSGNSALAPLKRPSVSKNGKISTLGKNINLTALRLGTAPPKTTPKTFSGAENKSPTPTPPTESSDTQKTGSNLVHLTMARAKIVGRPTHHRRAKTAFIPSTSATR